ncbi:hypothetical protein SMICM304S_02601 [Streptomyces microflavus]
MRTLSRAFWTSWWVNPAGTVYVAGFGLATGATCSRLTKSIAYVEELAASFWSRILAPAGTVLPSMTLASS